MAINPYRRFDSFAPGKKAQKFSTGNRIYNGTSPSPQVGQGSVNPVGYQQRDNKAQMKRKLLQNQVRRVQ